MKKVFSTFVILSLILAVSFLSSCKPSGTPKNADTTQVAAVDTTLNCLTAQEKADGWILMFDGKTSAGWRGYNNPAFPDSGWVVENGTLHCLGSGHGEAGGKGGDIIYDKKFQDFDLKLEWKISEGGNSGIFIMGEEMPNEPIWKSAPEDQVLDDARHPDANLGKDGDRRAGSLYDLIPTKVAAKPAGEWNQVEIISYQGTVVFKMNGEEGLEFHLGTPDWDKLVKGSKFKDFPEFGKLREGFIGLQDHGNDVWYRNIKIKPGK